MPVAAHFFDVGHGSHHHSPTPGGVGLENALVTQDQPAGGKVRPLEKVHQIFDRDVVQLVVAVNDVTDSVAQLPQVVGRDVGGHSHSDARSAVEQQIWQFRRQHGRLLQCLVKVGDEIHRLLADVLHHLLGNGCQAHLGVAHGRRCVPIHAAKVTLAVHQQVAQRKVLGHAGHGVVDRRVAVGVILAQHFTDNTSALFVRRAGLHSHVVHGVENTPVHRL